MSHKFIHQCTNQFLWLVVILVLIACTAPLTTPTSVPTASPQADAELPLLTMLEYGYQFRYPSEYQAWELDVETGEFREVSSTMIPTAAP